MQNLKLFLKENEKLRDEIEHKVLVHYGVKTEGDPGTVDAKATAEAKAKSEAPPASEAPAKQRRKAASS